MIHLNARVIIIIKKEIYIEVKRMNDNKIDTKHIKKKIGRSRRGSKFITR